MKVVTPFTDEQTRNLINVRQQYEVWRDADRDLKEMPYNLRIKDVSGISYLYELTDREGNMKSLGRLDDERRAQFDRYKSAKHEAKSRLETSRKVLAERARIYRSLQLPMLDPEAGKILREADRRRLLGSHLMVVGTNAMPAYHIEAGGRIRDVPEETYDFDLAWTAEPPADETTPVWMMLKAVDQTYTVNSERKFQARNAKAYEVEILAAPSRMAGMFRKDQPRPIPLPEQEWLLLGGPVDQVVICRDNAPARIVAPDPRYFGLHKLWMAKKDGRNPLKQPKDEKQGMLLLDAVAEAMPHYKMGKEFASALPEELRPHYDRWSAQWNGEPVSPW